MADSPKLQKAGLDVKQLPEAAIEALSKLSDEELVALAKAQKSLAPLGSFGGIVF
jgi:hypothetical protein